MGLKQHAIAANPLRSKADLALAFEQLTKPLIPYYSEGKALLQLGVTGSSYAPEVAQMEGFSRVMWGLAPLLAGDGLNDELLAVCLEGITNGTDPEHPEYWGQVNDYDQRLVEMAALGFALALVPEQIWEPLSIKAQQNFYNWLNQINEHPVYDCNWLFFHVLVNIGFYKRGLSYDAEQMETNLKRVEDFYLGEGWYADGIGGHSDYYVPFAIQYYALLYSKLMAEEDPERAARFKQRAGQFAGQFIHWFAEDGRALPYGRSMAYRFSQGALWGALAYADVDALPPGVLKGLFLRHLRWWFRQSIFASDGVMTIGYAYPNLVMAENYNAPGSVYWAMKAFLPLALSEDHPFWQAEELPLPELPALSAQQAPHLVFCRQAASDHVAAFNTGHLATNEHTHTSAKYEKFVYSASFGFSVPRAEWGLSQGAFDNMLALSEGDNIYRVRRRNEETSIDGRVLTSRWKPWRDVEITTYLLAGLPWHLRIHRIETARELDAAEGGFALPLAGSLQLQEQDGAVSGQSGFGVCGIAAIRGYDSAELVGAQANTNLIHPRTVIPTLRAKLAPGVHVLVSAVYGEPGAAEGFALDGWQAHYSVKEEAGLLVVFGPVGEVVKVEL
ncbi:hypothetical protein FHS18_006119 [Paenibacillus phyllosphaerae]|uniref:DUF2264 domain-containing protein n=1 Tax=Paenibacillus phyllosphaerae TaxID=274593 RepID=A0A7W5B408_9BACL|nr:DUF2264 domain-containing protein [Paenibacillus phyllosphaerae]MBB3114003.1 hypothetical protein [Paenibacillus phyllosphaerae]